MEDDRNNNIAKFYIPNPFIDPPSGSYSVQRYSIYYFWKK